MHRVITHRPERRPWRRPERRLSSGGQSAPGAITFPATNLDARVYIALGANLSQPPATWVWEDITHYVRFASGVSLTNGRRDETSTIQAGSGYLVLDNRDGRFCRRNPRSPYYGLLSKNTPIWGTVNAGSGVKTRLQHFVNEWPTRWDKSGNDCVVTIGTAGILRRLAQGVVLKSPLRRSITFDSPAAYWPMEEGSDATQAVSALAGGRPLVASSSGPVPGASLVPVGSDGAWNLSAGGTLTASTGIAAGVVSSWEAELTIGFNPFPSDNPSGNQYVVATFNTPGSEYDRHGIWLLYNYWSDARYYLGIFSVTPGGTVNGFAGDQTQFIAVDQSQHIRILLTQSGSNIVQSFYIDGVLCPFTANVVGTLYAPTYVTLSGDFFSSAGYRYYPARPSSLSHVGVFSPQRTTATTYQAVSGYTGEYAHERIRRICREERILYRHASASDVAMGPQPRAKALDVLRECEEADMGSLFEVDWGLGFQSTLDRYNAAVGLTLDFNQGQIAESPLPADDDQRTRNKVTVSRSTGSEYTSEETSGPMGTGAQGPGIYEDSATVNVASDNQLPSQAGWRSHLGTVDEDRWPSLALNFDAAPELIDTWTALPFGARVNVTNPPPETVPDTIDAIVEGYTERWDTRSWTASLNTSPASPYLVNVVGSTSGNLGRVDAANSTLAADATSSDTTISVASPNALWRTGAVSFDIGVAGERMTVTNISGGSSPQTFTVTRSQNGVSKAQSAVIGGIATKVSLWKPGVYAL